MSTRRDIGKGIVAAMAAITPGFMIEGASDSFRAQRNDLVAISAKIIFLDKLLSNYGPETKDTRETLVMTQNRAIPGAFLISLVEALDRIDK